MENKYYKIVDSREPETKTIHIRSALIETGWMQQKLDSGDMAFRTCKEQLAGVTRKTTSDCLNSLNKNFARQLEEMLEVYDICIMLIENAWQWTATGQMLTNRGLEQHSKKEVLNYLHRWQAKGFILERTANWQDTVTRLNELFALYQKPYSLSARSKGYADERLLALPSGLRGKAGERLLKNRSLLAIANMEVDQLLELKVAGIGKKRAELVYNYYRRVSNGNIR